jgi:hypothetical protein
VLCSYFAHAPEIFRAAPRDVANDVVCQFAKVAVGILSSTYGRACDSRLFHRTMPLLVTLYRFELVWMCGVQSTHLRRMARPPRRTRWRRLASRFVMLCCAVPCRAVLCCAVLCCAVLCCAVLCCAVLCCAVLCCAVLYTEMR